MAEKENTAAWQKVIEDFARLGVPESAVECLVTAGATPAGLESLMTLLAESPKLQDPPARRVERFLEAVDESIASLPEWIGALEVLLAELQRQGRTTSLEMATGYLGCCGEAMASGAAFTDLAAATADMLALHGFQG